MNNYSHKNLSKNLAPEDVFCECYSQLRKYIYTYLFELTGDSNLASDLNQTVFLKFWTLRDKYPMIGDAKAYLKRMAGNAFRDACRQDKSRMAYINTVSYTADLSQFLTEVMFDEKELERTFQQATLDLSGQRKIVFVLSKIEGWPREKNARTLGISPFTVKVTLQNALREVRKCGPHYQFSINKSK